MPKSAARSTIFFATVNSLGEQLPTVSFTILASFASIISQLPGIALAIACYRHASGLVRVLLLPAFFVAVTGLLAYLAYAFNGKAESLDSAAHMHVIMFPILHCIIALIAYALFAIVFAFISLVKVFR